MSDQENEEMVPIEVIYAGQRVDSKGKRNYVWMLASDPKTSWGWHDKLHIPAGVGNICQFHETADGQRFRVSGALGPKYLRRHEDTAQIRVWAIQDEAAKQRLIEKSLATKSAKVDPLDDLLKPIHDVAQYLTAVEKRALFAKIAEVIHRA